jgi:hypothetical protein
VKEYFGGEGRECSEGWSAMEFVGKETFGEQQETEPENLLLLVDWGIRLHEFQKPKLHKRKKTHPLLNQ